MNKPEQEELNGDIEISFRCTSFYDLKILDLATTSSWL
jgi:hypothetical protein